MSIISQIDKSPSSLKAIPTLNDFMTKNKATCIWIECDGNVLGAPDLLRDSESFELSIARSKTLYDILHDVSDIDTSRMHYLGKGT